MYEEKEIQYKKRKSEKTSKENTKKEENEKKKTTKITNVKTKNNKTKTKKNSKKKITKGNKKKQKSCNKKKCVAKIPTIFAKINWKQLILKLSILLLSMMLIIFTLSRIKRHHENQNAAFNKNINAITEATLKYFSNNPLPINIGDSSSFILEEMKNLNLIGEIKDNNNYYCNYLDSYIIFTKIKESEYRLKINLKCSSKNNVVEERIICTKNHCSKFEK